MTQLLIPAVHLPNGLDLFRPLPYTPSTYKKVLKSYGERSLLEAVPEDYIVLNSMPEEEYLHFLLSNGIGTENIIQCFAKGGNLAEDILLDKGAMSRIEQVSEKCEELSFYIHLEEEREIAGRIGREEEVMHPALTRMFNRYYFLLRICEDLDIELNETVQVRSGRFLGPASRLFKEWGKLFVRGNESVGGMQVYIVDSEEALHRTAESISRNVKITRYFVSRFLNVDESWNVQFSFAPGRQSYIGSSRQIVSGGTAHVGNEGGTDYHLPGEIRLLCEKIADRLGAMGALGKIGIDVMTIDGVAYPAEINARKNTSTPALSLYKKMDRESDGGRICFRVIGIETAGGIGFKEFVSRIGSENLFDMKSGRGILPYHFASSRVTGKIDAAVFSRSPEDAINIIKEVMRRFEKVT